jgi:hypothetical protein
MVGTKQSLVQIFAEIGHFGKDIGCNDKNGTHSYLPVYDKLFEPFRTACTMLEIGLATGDSLKLWDRYFENSKIVGADISIVFQPDEYRNDVTIVEADATKEAFLGYFRHQTFDIIIDDGSHVTQDQIDTFNIMRRKMNNGGIYIIEDILALEVERNRYLSLHENVEIIDLRHVKQRFDDALVIIRF